MFNRTILLLFTFLLGVSLVSFAAEKAFEKVKLEEVDAGMPYTVKEIPVTDPQSLKGVKIAMICAHGFEEIEGTYPLRYFTARGAVVDVITPDWIKGRVMAVQFLKPSIWLPVTKNVSDAKATDYCAVFVPGGAWNPIIMRTDGKILAFLSDAYKANKLVTSICHGPQVLISAGLVKDKDITGVSDIRTDLRNAGGRVIEDQPSVVDGHILTSRDPHDLAEFCQAVEEYLHKNVKFCHGQEVKPAQEMESISMSMQTVNTMPCSVCNGTGKLTGGPGNYPYPCPTCFGTGRVPSDGKPPVSTDH
ncbi:MAG: DJ-1/PfpI family protein [Candidatus Riflebacteria bacterium]|nr:DJ-1/PfpI family protein [Candidatus Riflebacteria bacterium]